MEPVERALHIWLDAFGDRDRGHHGDYDELNELWDALVSVGAVDVSLDDEGDAVTVNARPALGAALLVMEGALSALTNNNRYDRIDAINRIRYFAHQLSQAGDAVTSDAL